MAFTVSPYFTVAVLSRVTDNLRLRTWLGEQFKIMPTGGRAPKVGQEGNITVRIDSSAAPQTLTPGSILTANGANTTATLVGRSIVSIPYQAEPHQYMGIEFTGDDEVTWGRLAKDELGRDVVNTVISDLKAAAAGQTSTLTTGQARFLAVSQAQQIDNETKLWASISFVVADCGGDLSQLAVIIEQTSFGNLLAGRQFLKLGETKINESQGMFQFFTVPLIPVVGDNTKTWGATNFGKVSTECAFIVGMECYGLQVSEPFVPGGGPMIEQDNYLRLKVIMSYWHGVVNTAKLAEVVSGSS